MQDAMFYGRGAGELPTASAVVGDVFDIVRNILHDCCGRIGCTCYKNLPIKHMNEISSKFFIRMFVEDRPGVLANIERCTGSGKRNVYCERNFRYDPCGINNLQVLSYKVIM